MSLIYADARHIPLRNGCVQCVVTSPPYWGLRDYQAANQIGLESTPADYVAQLVCVFGEVWRVLRDDGTCWINLGDSYAASGPAGGVGKQHTNVGSINVPVRVAPDGLKPKDLVGIPWRVAFALQAAGWYLRSDIIWSKVNPMPESVTDRPTKSHEYLFLLTKRERYFYDAAAIMEQNSPTSAGNRREFRGGGSYTNGNSFKNDALKANRTAGNDGEFNGRNKRSVWTIATLPYAGAHFATMPEALVEPCILAGCPMGGLVFDPFLGSGTVGAVAERLGRRWVGSDLRYHDLAAERTAQRGLRFEMA